MEPLRSILDLQQSRFQESHRQSANLPAKSGFGKRVWMVIHWRLAVVMAERNVSNKELALKTGMHPRSVSRLKTRRRLTRIDEETLDLLCKALQCQPGDLMVYEPDEPKPPKTS